MEVHHHSHLASGETHTERKKWTHYLWEFLMLFLAVFCGFLAENQREHMVEKNRGRQYIISLNQDLKIDQEQLQNLLPAFEKKDKRLDTLLILLKDVSPQNGANGLYNYFYDATRYPDFVYTDRTIMQLKNSGGLRLITNSKVSDSIIAYDASVKLMDIHIKEGVDHQMFQVRDLSDKLFDYRCCPSIGNIIDNYEAIRFPYPGELTTYDKKAIIEYFNAVVQVKRVFNIQKWNIELLLSQNKRLQNLIKKEYHLK